MIFGLIDNICYEIVHHRRASINYTIMTDIVVTEIVYILTNRAKILD